MKERNSAILKGQVGSREQSFLIQEKELWADGKDPVKVTVPE